MIILNSHSERRAQLYFTFRDESFLIVTLFQAMIIIYDLNVDSQNIRFNLMLSWSS